MTPSAVICTGVGAWIARLGGGGDWVSLAISHCISQLRLGRAHLISGPA